jgi:hypothetical protein
MDKSKAFQIVKKLQLGKKSTLYREGDLEVFIYRPAELSKRFKDYNVKKNFQIWLKEGKRKFKPNHLRVFIDLNLRVRSQPKLKRDLLIAFDNIFYGKDPEKELKNLANKRFEHYLNPITAIGVMSQLFIIEQEYCYHRTSMFNPPTLFYQGWIREFIDNPKEIDNLTMSVAHGQPPKLSYVDKENKKSKHHTKNLSALWYLERS